MHIETRIQGKKKKYYLAHAVRTGKRVRQLRFYLGSSLSKVEIAEKRRYGEAVLRERIAAQRVIRDPFRAVLSPQELDDIKALEAKGKLSILHLSEADWNRFAQLFTYDTNAIEGSTVTASEVRDILERDKLPEKPKSEISETYGVRKAVDYVRKTKKHISLALIKELHRIVFRDSKPFAGRLRGRGTEVAVVDGAGNILHRGAPSEYITPLLEELVMWYKKNEHKYPPLVLAAVVHNQFENIHPFQDGNGRVGRLLLNNVLLKHKLPPVNIELKNRREYYHALHAYEKGDLQPTMELLLREYRALRKSIN